MEGHTSVDPANAADPTGTEHDLISDALMKRWVYTNIEFPFETEHGEDDADVQQGECMSTMVEERQSGRFVTAREYYCFLMQVREGLFNILLFGGRLFQQWVVDMYIKIESMRLDWYSNPDNQKLIQAELYQVSYAVFY
jgi:hypothetical protein